MGIIKAAVDAFGGTLADQWIDIITAGSFDEHTVVAPGIQKSTNRGRGSNQYSSDGVLSDGSKILVPENTAAFVFSQAGIEEIIDEPGGYEYRNGQNSIFDGNTIKSSIVKQVKERIGYGGITPDEKRIAFVNLREIRNIRFGTKGPQIYNDLFYGTDLEVSAYGSFSVKVIDPAIFIKNFVPPNTFEYSFDNKRARGQVLSEFIQSFMVALNSLSAEYRVSQLPGKATELSQRIATDPANAGTWPGRFGFKVVRVALENIEFSESSRELVRKFSEERMKLNAFDGVSKKAADIAAQQKIAEGVRDNGLGDGGGMLFGMNLAQGLGSDGSTKPAMSFDEQIEAVKKLKELLDVGILTQEEFDTKKKEIMNL